MSHLDGSKSGGRKIGTDNPRSRQLLYKLEKDHNFNIVPKIIKLYEQTDQLYQPLFEKVIKLMSEQKPIPAVFDRETRTWSEGLLPTEVELFNRCRQDLWVILGKLLGYTYPKLRSLQVDTTDADKIIFNISIPKALEKDVSISSSKSSKGEQEDAYKVH